METIKSIKEVYNFKVKGDTYSAYDGYEVVTYQQTILVGISNSQSCCESWGYLSSNDDLQQFEGATLLSVEVTGPDLDTKNVLLRDGVNEDACMFVTFVTDVGPFQLVAYNEHNGYYGHDAVVISRDLNHSECL